MKATMSPLWPQARHSPWIRMLATVLVVAVGFLARLGLDRHLHQNPLLLLAPTVVICAYFFGVWSGCAATLLTACLAGYFFMDPRQSLAGAGGKLLPLVLYAAAGCLATYITERLHEAVRRLERSEAEKSLLLEELTHRSRNNLSMVASMLSLQARGLSDPEARAALESAVNRIDVIGRAQERLRAAPGHQGEVEIADYLKSLCASLGDMLRDVRPIAVRVRAPYMKVPEARAIALGLIANELVTNAFKYAFPDDAGGSVDVILEPIGAGLELVVQDDGVGYQAKPGKGLGTRLVSLMAAQQGGRVDYPPVPVGCRVVVTLPEPAEG